MMFGMEGCGNYFHADEIQGRLDNMTAMTDMMESMDSNPKTDFSLNDKLRESLDGMNGMKGLNVTEIIPSFIEEIPFGTDCSWGSGATYNLIASLIYFACGVLLCCTPNPAPIYSQKEVNYSAADPAEGTNLSDSDNLGARPGAKIV